VAPADTDARIDRGDAPHHAYAAAPGLQPPRLFVFFGGAYSKPQHFTEIAGTAASLGYHVIVLSYPNDFLINGAICARSFDPACFENLRMEVYDGIDRHPAIDVGWADSILNRLSVLLQYLDRNHPEERWRRFLRADGTPRWHATALGGHSQGAGYAGLIAKFKPVQRVLMFAGFDWFGAEERPADWMYRPSATAAEAIYGFSHLLGQSAWDTDMKQLNAWRVLYIDAFGPLIDVDTIAPPYQGSHMLATRAAPQCFIGECQDYHSAVVVDAYTPRLANGEPLFKPVWQYMLGN